jgi:hypothetical protein
MSSPRQCEIEKVGAAQKRRRPCWLRLHIILFKFGQKEAKQWDIKAAINCLARATLFAGGNFFWDEIDGERAASSAFCYKSLLFVLWRLGRCVECQSGYSVYAARLG